MVRESQIQKDFWTYLGMIPVPEGGVLQDYSYAVPNGVWIPGDPKRSARLINSMKAQGFRPGVSDIVIALPRHGFHGAYLELKRDLKSPTSDEQLEWVRRMSRVGYFAEIAHGSADAMAAVQRYLSGHRLASNVSGGVQSRAREENP
jgi:hypothetical protein